MKKPKMISMKLPAALIAEIKRVAFMKGITVYEAVEACYKGCMCPVCHKRWPKESDPKVSFKTKVNPKVIELAESKDIPSRYYVAALHHALGYCPACSQKRS